MPCGYDFQDCTGEAAGREVLVAPLSHELNRKLYKLIETCMFKLLSNFCAK